MKRTQINLIRTLVADLSHCKAYYLKDSIYAVLSVIDELNAGNVEACRKWIEQLYFTIGENTDKPLKEAMEMLYSEEG